MKKLVSIVLVILIVFIFLSFFFVNNKENVDVN